MRKSRDERTDIEAWDLQPATADHPAEPPRLYRIFTFYLKTRSLREACRLAWGEGADKPVSVPGNVSAASIKWRWAERAQAFDDAESKKAVAEFKKEKADSRKRRRRQNERMRTLLDTRLSQLDARAMKRLQPHRAFAAVLALNDDERTEYHEKAHDDETRFDPGLPALEERIPPPPEPHERVKGDDSV